MNKVIRLFLDTDMRNQHAGLAAIAKDKGVSLDKLEAGEHVIFINQKLNRVKVCSRGNVLSYAYKQKGTIDLAVFGEIASSFSPNGKINFDDALKASLLKRLGKKEIEAATTPKKYSTNKKALDIIKQKKKGADNGWNSYAHARE